MVIGLQQARIVLILQISNGTISHSFLNRYNFLDGQTARNTCAAQSRLTTRQHIPDVWNAADDKHKKQCVCRPCLLIIDGVVALVQTSDR